MDAAGPAGPRGARDARVGGQRRPAARRLCHHVGDGTDGRRQHDAARRRSRRQLRGHDQR